MQNTEFFILFPEYCDDVIKPSAPYMQETDLPDTECQLPVAVCEMLHIIEFVGYERTSRYYDSKNVDNICRLYDELQYPNPANVLKASLHKFGFENWRSVLADEEFEVSYRGNKLYNDTCALVCKRYVEDGNNATHTVMLATNSLVLEKGLLKFDSDKGCRFVLEVKQDLKSLYDWFCEKRLPQRRFDINDKHGKNGKGGRSLPGGKKAGLLLCNKSHAQDLLNRAIGTEGVDGDLWYYDKEYERYIYFENQYENVQPAFHGYHLNDGDKNYDKIDKDLLKEIMDVK